MMVSGGFWAPRIVLIVALTGSIFSRVSFAQNSVNASATIGRTSSEPYGLTTEQYNRRLQELMRFSGVQENSSAADYRVGPEDLLQISFFEAPELDRTVRVSANGQISLPLVAPLQAAGLTSRELEVVIQELLRRTYMKDPHVAVFVKEMQSHPISVFGAVKKPGVFQIRGPKRLIEVLSMAEGLSEDAGDTVVVMRQAHSPTTKNQTVQDASATDQAAGGADARPTSSDSTGAETLNVNLKSLLNSGDASSNALIFPGDVVKVTPAGVVYVVGEVKKPGGFMLKTNENISVLQALSLAEGLTRTSARSRVRIIHTDAIAGTRTETPINLNKILAGKMADPILQPKDILFIPNSAGRSVLYRGAEAALGVGTGIAVYRR